MTLATAVLLLLSGSIILSVFSFGLSLGREDTLFLVKRPVRLAASLLSMQVLMPLLAAMFAIAFDLHPAVKVALVALSVAPVSPLLPAQARKAGGRVAYMTGLFAGTALLSVVTIPATLAILGPRLGLPGEISSWQIARPVLMTVLVPLLAGLTLRLLAPSLASRLIPSVRPISSVALAVSVIPLLVIVWPAFVRLIGNGTLLAIAVFSVVALMTGHVLGGRDPENRVVLALSTASRHPGVAIVIANVAAPRVEFAAAAILLYLLATTATTTAYIRLTSGSRVPSRESDRPGPHTTPQWAHRRA